MTRFVLCLAALTCPSFVLAQDATSHYGAMAIENHDRHGIPHAAATANHEAHAHHGVSPEGVSEVGQSAFAAIQEIVAKLMADPETDWSRVDIEVLRQHLVDMHNVTLHSRVTAQEIEGGARFEAVSKDPAVTASIRAMAPAHMATMDGAEGWKMRAETIPGGAALTVTGEDPLRIRALGFIGVMTVGMHHQAHHLALATGQNPHTP